MRIRNIRNKTVFRNAKKVFFKQNEIFEVEAKRKEMWKIVLLCKQRCERMFLRAYDYFLCKKFYNSLKIGQNFFLQHFKNKIIYNFLVKFMAAKKVLPTNIFSPLSFLAVFGSGIPDPQHWLEGTIIPFRMYSTTVDENR
jgi:hypothetical protein